MKPLKPMILVSVALLLAPLFSFAQSNPSKTKTSALPKQLTYTIMAETGGFTAIKGQPNHYTLTLNRISYQIAYVGQPPYSLSNIIGIQSLLANWNQGPNNPKHTPPNALLLSNTADGFFVDSVRLTKPKYNPITQKMVFHAEQMGKLGMRPFNFFSPVTLVFTATSDLILPPPADGGDKSVITYGNLSNIHIVAD